MCKRSFLRIEKFFVYISYYILSIDRRKDYSVKAIELADILAESLSFERSIRTKTVPFSSSIARDIIKGITLT